MKVVYNNSESDKILVKDLPVLVTLGDLCLTCSKVYKVMTAIANNDYNNAFNIAKEVFEYNDKIISDAYDKDKVLKLIDSKEQ